MRSPQAHAHGQGKPSSWDGVTFVSSVAMATDEVVGPLAKLVGSSVNLEIIQ